MACLSSSGSDGTAAVGSDCTLSFSSAQAAYNAADTYQKMCDGTVIISLGVGHFGGINLSQLTTPGDWNPNIRIQGAGDTLSFLGGINGDAPSDSDSGWSITVYGTDVNLDDISSNGGSVSGRGGSIEIHGPVAGNITVNGGDGGGGGVITIGEESTVNGNVTANGGGSGGSIRIGGIVTGNVTANGGGSGGGGGEIGISGRVNGDVTANGGTGSDPSGGGGNGGNINIDPSGTVSGTITANGGAGYDNSSTPDTTASKGVGGTITVSGAVGAITANGGNALGGLSHPGGAGGIITINDGATYGATTVSGGAGAIPGDAGLVITPSAPGSDLELPLM